MPLLALVDETGDVCYCLNSDEDGDTSRESLGCSTRSTTEAERW